MTCENKSMLGYEISVTLFVAPKHIKKNKLLFKPLSYKREKMHIKKNLSQIVTNAPLHKI